jgi:hypothetical protein
LEGQDWAYDVVFCCFATQEEIHSIITTLYRIVSYRISDLTFMRYLQYACPLVYNPLP